MKVTLERLPESLVQLDIEVDQERLEKSLQVAYRKVAGKARIPGFRPGKAPRQVVERMIGREGLIREALDTLVPDVYNDVIAEHDIDAIDQPDLEIVDLEPVRFKATVPVRPTIDLGPYTELRVEQPETAFDEEEVDRQVLRLRRAHATYAPVERGAEWNDQLIAGVIGKVALGSDDDEETADDADSSETPDGDTEVAEDAAESSAEAVAPDVPEAEAEEAELITFIQDDAAEFSLREGEDLLVPGLAEAFLGMKAGDSKSIDIEVAADHRISQLAGKTAHFELTVAEVKEEQLPETDEEFANTINPQFESFDELKDDITRQLKDRTAQESDVEYRNKAIDALLEAATLDYPKVMVEREIDNVIRDSTGNNATPYQDYLRRVGRTEAEFRDTFREAAELRVRRGLVLGKLSDDEKIEITDEDIQAELEKMFGELADDDGRFRALFDSEVGRETIRRDLVNRRTMDKLLEIASGGAYVAPVLSTPPTPMLVNAPDEAESDESDDAPAETEAKEEQE